MAFRPVCEGPLGAVFLQPPPKGQPAQTLPHRAQLRLALCLHSTADAHAPGGPKVGFLRLRIEFRQHFHFILYFPYYWQRHQ